MEKRSPEKWSLENLWTNFMEILRLDKPLMLFKATGDCHSGSSPPPPPPPPPPRLLKAFGLCSAGYWTQKNHKGRREGATLWPLTWRWQFLYDSNFFLKWNLIFQMNQKKTFFGDHFSGEFFPGDHFSADFFLRTIKFTINIDFLL